MSDIFSTLDNLAKELKSPAKLHTVGEMAAGFIRNHIYKGNGFAPLSPATTAYRGQGRPLQDTGSLRDSITYDVIDSETVSIGTNKSYAPIQNNGGTITAKKNWLWIPAAGTRQLQRRYGYTITQVLNGLKGEGYSLFRMGRTMCYSTKGKGKQKKTKVIYYLVKSVKIPKREFFYISNSEPNQITKEVNFL